jgi:hypothetical protein
MSLPKPKQYVLPSICAIRICISHLLTNHGLAGLGQPEAGNQRVRAGVGDAGIETTAANKLGPLTCSCFEASDATAAAQGDARGTAIEI